MQGRARLLRSLSAEQLGTGPTSSTPRTANLAGASTADTPGSACRPRAMLAARGGTVSRPHLVSV